MESNKADAKELFFKFGGDRYQMEREGVLDDYRALEVPQSTEKLWAKEYEESLFEHFRERRLADSQTITLFKLIVHFQSDAGLLGIVSIIEDNLESMDSFTKIRLCEEIEEAVSAMKKATNIDKRSFHRALRFVSQLLPLIQKDPITVHPYYRALPHLPEALEESRLRLRITKLAKEIGIT